MVFCVGFVLKCVGSMRNCDDIDNCEQDGINELDDFGPGIFTSCLFFHNHSVHDAVIDNS